MKFVRKTTPRNGGFYYFIAIAKAITKTSVLFDPQEIRIFVLLCVFATVANGYKILFLAPMFGKSHWLFSESLVKALLQRGHEVTCVTSFGLSGTKPANYTEVLLEEKMDVDSLSKSLLFT